MTHEAEPSHINETSRRDIRQAWRNIHLALIPMLGAAIVGVISENEYVKGASIAAIALTAIVVTAVNVRRLYYHPRGQNHDANL